jgi:hypothetical protein
MTKYSAAGIAYHSGAHEFTPVLSRDRVAQPLVFCVDKLRRRIENNKNNTID